MIDITHKSPTLRKATAQALVKVSKAETIQAVKAGTVPKGDVLEAARVAGLFAAKRTADMIPDCHPLPVEFTQVNYELNEMEIRILVEIGTIYKTGVEVEAMHAASVVALTIYDMLKPIDKGISIEQIRLEEKKGGKSDMKRDFSHLKANIVVCSDTISSGHGEDRSGRAIREKLDSFGVSILDFQIIPDEREQIQNQVSKAKSDGVNLLIFTGGTGLSPRDITPEVLEPLLDRRIPGMEETIRRYGQERVPTAFLSRSLAGTVDGILVLALPGSEAGARESMEAVFPAAFHSFKMLKGERHG